MNIKSRLRTVGSAVVHTDLAAIGSGVARPVSKAKSSVSDFRSARKAVKDLAAAKKAQAVLDTKVSESNATADTINFTDIMNAMGGLDLAGLMALAQSEINNNNKEVN